MSTRKAFTKVALIGRQRGEGIIETLHSLRNYLRTQKIDVMYEEETAAMLSQHNKPAVPRDELAKHCDIIIAVGGDGSLLNAAHIAAQQNLPVLGINRGRLGFLTDIYPEEFAKISKVLSGEYKEEKRFLLNARLTQGKKVLSSEDALNDVVLLPGDVAHMIEFAIYVNQEFVCNQRADGLIVATPTGSTAYALSGGGPILHPALDAMVLVPMFPHTLSNRPIVVHGDSTIEIIISETNEVTPFVSCDGQRRVPVPAGSKIHISKKPAILRLIHPSDYNYFETLRVKLGWAGKH